MFFYSRKKLLKFEAEGREFSKFLRSLEQFTYSNSEGLEQFFGNRMLQTNKCLKYPITIKYQFVITQKLGNKKSNSMGSI